MYVCIYVCMDDVWKLCRSSFHLILCLYYVHTQVGKCARLDDKARSMIRRASSVASLTSEQGEERDLAGASCAGIHSSILAYIYTIHPSIHISIDPAHTYLPTYINTYLPTSIHPSRPYLPTYLPASIHTQAVLKMPPSATQTSSTPQTPPSMK